MVEPLLLEGMMALSLILLGAGFALKTRQRHAVRIAGWLLFAAYWPFQAEHFFALGDPFNGWFSLLGPILLLYVVYHEWMSMKWDEDPSALRWLAGTTAIAAATFFLFTWWEDIAVLTQHVVSIHTNWMLSWLFGVESTTVVETTASGERFVNLYLTNDPSPYAVTIILACTAVQSIMIFVGAIMTLDAPVDRKRRAYLLTIPAIYVLNLFRNAGIVYGYKIIQWNPFGWGGPNPGGWRGYFWTDMSGPQGYLGLAQGSFEWMHSWVGKWGSLGALILIALAVFSLLPELHGHILDLFDLPKRRKAGFFAPKDPPKPASVEAGDGHGVAAAEA